jgi:hypothetical protein
VVVKEKLLVQVRAHYNLYRKNRKYGAGMRQVFTRRNRDEVTGMLRAHLKPL